MRKIIFILLIFLFYSFSFLSYAQIYYEENSYPGDDGYYQSESNHDYYYRQAEAAFPAYDDSYHYPKKHKRRKIEHYEINGSPFATDNSPIPQYIQPPTEKLILINPNRHAWGAYTPTGRLIRWGIATAGSSWCRDLGRSCRTKVGSFRIYTLGDESCISRKFPLGEGGAPMPYCMFFNGGQALHGSNQVVTGNISHGCVRLHVSEAKWLRYHFVEEPNAANRFRGTKVVVAPY